MKHSQLMQTLRSERGLTLVEIIVVLIILSVLMAFFGSKLFGKVDQAKASTTKIKMEEIKSTINLFQLQYQSFPSGLDVLVKGSSELGSGYIPMANDEGVHDAWGTYFVYQTDGKAYSIKSLGADKIEGGEGVNFDITLMGP